jgi:hypothetical protein
MSRKLEPGDLDYLTEADIETQATIFACATAMIGLDMFTGDKMQAQPTLDRLLAGKGRRTADPLPASMAFDDDSVRAHYAHRPR